jgi:hypothetical protein
VPGNKYASIKRRDIYRALRAKGYSKRKSARISNAIAGRKGKKGKKK